MKQMRSRWTVAAVVATSGVLIAAGQATACDQCIPGFDLHSGYDDTLAIGGGDGAAQASLSVPALSSRSSASAKLFLDFDGVYYQGTWSGKTPGGDGYVDAYDTDGNASSFTNSELNAINRIWQRVAEAYSPFDVDVTTIDPGNYGQREAARVVIGGDNTWMGGGGGWAFVGGFTHSDNSQGHTSWVFPKNLGNGNVHNTASAAIHEAGHQLGLSHQRRYDSNGNPLDGGYDHGDSRTAPHMGVTYSTNRGLWSDGTIGWNNGPIYQDDLAKLTSTSGSRYGNYWNGFGYREDDFGDTFETAVDLGSLTDGGFSAAGVIEQSTDRDLLQFTLGAQAQLSLDVINAPEFGMLDARLLLWNEAGGLLANIDPAENLNAVGDGLHASWGGILDAGSYFVGVGSHGGYGDIGQWYLTGDVNLIPEPSTAVFGGLALLLLRRRR